MKNNITPVLAVLLALTAIAAVTIPQSNSAQPVEATLLNYVPTPAQPGDLLDVYIQVENNGATAAEQVEVELEGTGELIPQGNAIARAGRIPAQNAYVTKFRVKVSADATTGESLLSVLTRQAGQVEQESTVTITIQEDAEAAYIKKVSINPEAIEPGKQATLDITVENLADSRIRDVSLSLDLDETNFIPIEGTTRQKVDSIGPRQQAVFRYQIGAKPSATADIYSIDATLSFLDDFGNQNEQTDTIGLVIDTEAKTQAYIDQVSRSGEDIEVTMRIVNRGLSEVKFVEATISEGNSYEIPSQQRQQYVGNIDPDDWETLRFTVNTKEESIQIPVNYRFSDAFNNQRSVEQTFTVDIPEEQGGGISPLTTIIIVLVLVGIGYYWYRRRKKKG